MLDKVWLLASFHDVDSMYNILMKLNINIRRVNKIIIGVFKNLNLIVDFSTDIINTVKEFLHTFLHNTRCSSLVKVLNFSHQQFSAVVEFTGHFSRDILSAIKNISHNLGSTMIYMYQNGGIELYDYSSVLVADLNGRSEVDGFIPMVPLTYSDQEISANNDGYKRAVYSINYLQSVGYFVSPNLPLLDSEKSIKPRSVDEVCQRVESLAYIVMKCRGVNIKIPPQKEQFLTTSERNFIQKATNRVTNNDIIHFSWLNEALAVLLWTLGFVELDLFEEIKPDLCKLVSNFKDLKHMNEKSQPRTLSQIMDLFDFYFRAHWVASNQRLNGLTADMPDVLNEKFIVERRRALGWVVEHREWDDVSLDI